MNKITRCPIRDLEGFDMSILGLDGWSIERHSKGLCLCSPGTSARELGYPDHSRESLSSLLPLSIKNELEQD